MNRYEFLQRLHEQLRPRAYLEIGVQSGASLRLARCPAIGVDPDPRLRYQMNAATRIAAQTSDNFFAGLGADRLFSGELDLAFVDGMHLIEFALRDFINIESHAHPKTVVVFDDVLPRNIAEAVRSPLPGDWTGDVWKLAPILAHHRPDLSLTLVDTAPTGLLLVRDLDPANTVLADRYADLLAQWTSPVDPPPEVLDRVGVAAPEAALAGVAHV